MRKIGLLTLPLHQNYGGILQILALYRFLLDQGFEPVFLHKEPVTPLKKQLFRSTIGRVLERLPVDVRGYRARAMHQRFVRAMMPRRTAILRTEEDLAAAVAEEQLDAVIVGSDQVWRLDYHRDTGHMQYFLNFARGEHVRKIAYAASFGTEEWQYPQWSGEIGRLLAGFDAVSVREQAGREICREEFGKEDVSVVLDPTLIVGMSLYDELLERTDPVISEGSVMRYVLDPNPTVQRIANLVMSSLGKEEDGIEIGVQGASQDVPHWLRAFRDSGFVVTDSFHGTIFAIIFRKPFVSVANRERGMVRFTSLLDALGLSDRLVAADDEERIARMVDTPIDYGAVEQRLEELRKGSRSFLLSALA